MSVQITDCTIRDGGYLLNKNSDPEFIKGVMRGLVKSGINFVETGFLQTYVTEDTLVYANSVDARRFLPKEKGCTEFLGFCDNSRYCSDNLDAYDGNSFKWLRISFAKHEVESALNFCDKAQEKGYIVQFNPMDAISYTDKERIELIKKVNVVKPGALSIVDTFGAMYLEDLVHIFNQMNDYLDSSISIGLHSHDNLGLSTALAEKMIELSMINNRNIIVDGSLYGMGRGAGNARTELIAYYLNKHHGTNYNIQALLDTIQQYIEPIYSSVRWGYDLSMFVCGVTHAHVDNIGYLEKKKDCSASEMYEVLKSMSTSERTRYGIGYDKSDFSSLEKAYDSYKESR